MGTGIRPPGSNSGSGSVRTSFRLRGWSGAIGPQLGLSLVQSIVIMVVGQAAGALIFGVFILMGKRTGVSQFALGRMAFGRRGNNIPSIINGLIIVAWTGLNTYIVLSLATYCLHRLGLPNNRTTEYSVAALIMIIQLIIGTLGFYAIRTFEKWTAPVLAAVMAVMTVLAFSKGHVVWNHSTVHGAGLITAASGLMTAVGIGWGFSWSPWASDYSRFTRPEVPDKRLYWASALATFLALIWLGVLGAAMASSSTNSDPAELVASLFGVMTMPVLLVIIHGAVAGNIENFYSAPLCFLAGGIKIKRWLGSIISGVIASAVLVAFLASTRFATTFTSYMDSFVIWTAAWGVIVIIDFFVLNRGRADVPALYASPEPVALRRRSLALTPRAGGRAGWQAGHSSTEGYRYSKARSPAPPAEWTSRGWLRSCLAGRRTGCCAAPSRMLSARLRRSHGTAARSWPEIDRP